MIIKHFNLKKNLDKKINFYLLYGKNIGLIEETINNILKPNFSKNIYYYDESDILSDLDNFREQILNNSLFENNKLIIINRATDKILEIIEELSEKKIQEIKIIIKSGILEKKSKLRTYFEKKDEFVIIPFYEDDNQTLMLIAQNFFRQNKIKINQENINFIVRKCVGNRIVLQSELEKIYNYAHKKLKIGSNEILKIINSAENHSISELTDQCLAKNKNKIINILNDNIPSTEDNIVILKSFLYKLKRLKKLKKETETKKNQDQAIASFRPQIFWKDKEIVKKQLNNLSLDEINQLILKVNSIELLVKNNSQISTYIVNDFILNG